jgi:heat shock protein HslJ
VHDHLGKELAFYSGGGFYLGNPRIHDIWVLDSLNGNKVAATEYPNGMPTLEFHLDGGKVYGFGGCNHISGNYYFIENQIQFVPPVTTLKMCMEMTGESSFLSLLNKKRYTYSFLANRLKLYRTGGAAIVFKKVD